MRILRYLFLIFGIPALAQAPQIPVTGTIGPGGLFAFRNASPVSFTSDANHTMAYPETSGGFVKVTSTLSLTATRNVVEPFLTNAQCFENLTTGGQAIQVIGASGTGVTIANGTYACVQGDGTNYVTASGGSSGYFTGTPTVAVTGTPTTGQVLTATSGSAATFQNAGGTSVNVNGSPVSSPNFNGTTPAAGSGFQNSTLQVSGSNVSVENPLASSSVFGLVQCGTGVSCAGGVISAGTSSTTYELVSQLGCAAQNTDLTAGGGTDDTACINTALAAATAAHPVTLIQDGASLISGNGIHTPPGGNGNIVGLGGGIKQTVITACGITGGNLATFTTTANTLATGNKIQVSGLSNCSALNNDVLTVLSSGLTSTQFEATVSASNVSSSAETGIGTQVYGTGFYLASGSGDAISNGINIGTGPDYCEQSPATPASRGANYLFKDFVINGNGSNQTAYCHGIQLQNANNVFIQNVTVYNVGHYSFEINNTGYATFDDDVAYASSVATINTDGIHVEGNSNDIKITNFTAHTGDDAIALNANEGVCGPITHVVIDNVTLDNAYRALRVDGLDTVCGNGLFPEVNYVSANNVVGKVFNSDAIFSNGAPSTSNIAIDNVVLSNWTIQNTATSSIFGQIELDNNVGALTLSNFTQDSPAISGHGLIEEQNNSLSFRQLTLNNVKILFSSAGSSMAGLFGTNSSSFILGTLFVDGLSVQDVGGSFPPMTCAICLVSGSAGTEITNVQQSAIDLSHITSVYNSGDLSGHLTNYTGIGVAPANSHYYYIGANQLGTGTGIKIDTTNQILGASSAASGLLLSQDGTNGGTSGGFIQLSPNSFGDGSQNQIGFGNGNVGGEYAVFDGNAAGHHNGYLGIGYGYAAIVPYPLSVIGESGFGCTSGVGCTATIDPSGNLSAVSGVFSSGSSNTPGTFTSSNTSNTAVTIANSSGGGYVWSDLVLGSSSGAQAGYRCAYSLGAIPYCFSSTAFILGATDAFQWASGSPNATGVDTSLSRTAAGVICAGNGTPGDCSGTFKAANITDSALAPGNCVQAGTAGILTTGSGPCVTIVGNYTASLGTGTLAAGSCAGITTSPFAGATSASVVTASLYGTAAAIGGSAINSIVLTPSLASDTHQVYTAVCNNSLSTWTFTGISVNIQVH